jgi:uncharacterized membrane protein
LTASTPLAVVDPPPIGESLSVGWKTFQQNPVPILLGMLCAMVIGLVPILGAGPAFAGMMKVSLRALRGDVPAPADGFAGLSDNAVDHIVMGLLQMVGLLACCIGVYVSQGIFFPGSLLILERNLTWDEARDVCWKQVKPNWLPWTLFALLAGLVGASGMILCFVGVLFTAPIAMIAMAHAYEKTFGASAARA